MIQSAEQFPTLVTFESQLCRCGIQYQDVFDLVLVSKDYREHKRMALFMTEVNGENKKSLANRYFIDCPFFYSIYWANFQIFKTFLPFAKDFSPTNVTFVMTNPLEGSLLDDEPRLPRYCLVQSYKRGFIKESSLIKIFHNLSPERLLDFLEEIVKYWHLYSDPRMWRNVSIFMYLFEELFKKENPTMLQWLMDEISGERRVTMLTKEENFELFKAFSYHKIMVAPFINRIPWLHGLSAKERELKILLSFVPIKHKKKDYQIQIIVDFANREYCDPRQKMHYVWSKCINNNLVSHGTNGNKKFREIMKLLK